MSDDIPVIQVGTKPDSSAINSWWNAKDEEIYKSTTGIVSSIRKNQSYRRTDNLRYARLYTNTDFDQFVTGVASGYFGRRLSFNVSRSTVDTACAKISKSRPRPLFLTSKGNFKQQRKAKQLTKYIDGTFYQGDIHSVSKQCFRDACIFGTGVMKIFPQDGQVKYERVFIDEIIVDDQDGRDGAPRQMHQQKLVHRDVLFQMCRDDGIFSDNKHAEDIVRSANRYTQSRNQSSSDMVEVVESWHLPSSPEAKDGKHVIALTNGTLLSEPYTKSYFPFCVMRWNKPVLGWYGEGLVAQVVGIQLEINTLLLRIKEAQELMAVPRIFVEEGSGVNTSHITDEIGAIVKYRGTRPEAMTWTAMNREIYDYLEYLYRKAFEDTGISQLSAMSKKPAGLDSGIALREFQDIETERFAIVAEDWQKFHLDAAKITIDMQRTMAEETPSISVNVKGKDFIETIKWKDVDLDDDKYIMQLYPTNLLPKTPEGQLQFTQELIQSGMIDADEGMSLLNFPDLEGFFNLRTASMDDMKFTLERIIEDLDYTPPEPYQDLKMAVRMANSAYLRSKTDGTSEEAQELLLRYIDECLKMLQSASPTDMVAPPMPSPEGAGPAGAIGQPAPAPVSNLMPIQ